MDSIKMFHRIVHLDLKGAPWKPCYLGKVIPLFKEWGATGVLVEWEDTFPYTADLIFVGSLGGCNREGLYSKDEVAYIFKCIKDNGMEPIQLVQTIGHMEFVLKHGNYRSLRELPRSPAVLCPSKPESQKLCKKLLRQLLVAQPGANFIHIGGDEAWHMNVCADCQEKAKNSEHGDVALFLDHIKFVASFIKDNYPDVKVLMWDDMLRTINADTLKAYELGGLVQPVVWNYSSTLNIDIHLWERYASLFPNLWFGSAYKGANGSCQMVCDVARYASNQLAWQEEMNVYDGEIHFRGVILTGWSRFDHYATMCELLPVALPSLASCLRMWSKPEGVTNEMVVRSSLPAEEWPGEEVSQAVVSFAGLRDRCLRFLTGDEVETWLNEWQLEHVYTTPLQVESIAVTAKQLQQDVWLAGRSLHAALSPHVGRRSGEEWLRSRVSPLHARLAALHAHAAARAAAPASEAPRLEKFRPID